MSITIKEAALAAGYDLSGYLADSREFMERNTMSDDYVLVPAGVRPSLGDEYLSYSEWHIARLHLPGDYELQRKRVIYRRKKLWYEL